MRTWEEDSRIPDWVQKTYEDISPLFDDTKGIPTEELKERMVEESEPIATESDADYALRYLLDRGWLYEVRGEIRRTD